jgi:luciferase family oxidoreductase group 1
MRGVASSAPAVLVGHLAGVTERIRVGAGGVLLPNHAPIVVAEQFGTLTALHPGRIDLGVGRAPGGSASAVAAVRGGREAGDFRRQLDELLHYLDPPDGARVTAVPVLGGNVPPVWLLGSSSASAELAAELALPYAFAHHLNPSAAAAALDAYGGAGASLVSVSVIVAEDDARAEWLAGSTRLKVLSRVRGNRIRLPSPEDAAAYPYSDADRAEIAARAGAVLVGGPATVADLLQAVLDDTGTAELMVTTPVFRHGDRLRSYELLATVRDLLRAKPTTSRA